MARKRCFVISPIGQPGSDVREHADDVFEYIVKPAMKALRFDVHRGDHMARPGKISEQMYDSILHDDLLVAILTFHNPNVFYELAIAHAAARPLVILCEASHSLPFDIKDQRVIFYDLKPRSLKTDRYVGELIGAVEALIASDAPHEVAFGGHLSPLGGMGENFRIFDRYIDAISAGSLPVKIIEAAKSSVYITGISTKGWHEFPDFAKVIEAATARRCRIHVLLMDAANPALPQMLNDDMEDYLPKVQQMILEGTEQWLVLRKGRESLINVRTVRRGIIYQQLVMSEHRMICAPYLLSGTSHESPSIQTDMKAALYQAMRKEFDFLWRRNDPPLAKVQRHRGKRRSR
jgi:hypothetical protein